MNTSAFKKPRTIQLQMLEKLVLDHTDPQFLTGPTHNGFFGIGVARINNRVWPCRWTCCSELAYYIRGTYGMEAKLRYTTLLCIDITSIDSLSGEWWHAAEA